MIMQLWGPILPKSELYLHVWCKGKVDYGRSQNGVFTIANLRNKNITKRYKGIHGIHMGVFQFQSNTRLARSICCYIHVSRRRNKFKTLFNNNMKNDKKILDLYEKL